jgi:hypothetical protein
MWIKYFFPIFFLCISLLGCNYHFTLTEVQPKRSEPGISIKKIYIAPFINRTSERNLGHLLMNALVYEFNTGGVLELVEKEKAQAILTGEFSAYEVSRIGYTRSEFTATGRVRIAIKGELKDISKNIILAEAELSDQEEFQVTRNPSYTMDMRERAIYSLIERLAERIYEELLVGL